ncbi:hypothetical protein IFM89_034565 [Coptis chinensis]|uniref:Pentatricopeptide repeat-containing protein n=1 Tax=Coptis chinensis TaxID=261450 RepID=A0A835LSH6_9MAGN|nr:hypothetical protein IFM89_034565 [Coptis chinensis]
MLLLGVQWWRLSREKVVVDKTKELFEEMTSFGVEPNLVSLEWFDSLGLIEMGFTSLLVTYVIRKWGLIHGYVVKQGLEGDNCVVCALVDMYGKCGCPLEMKQVFDESGEMDLGSRNATGFPGFLVNGLVDDRCILLCNSRTKRLN